MPQEQKGRFRLEYKEIKQLINMRSLLASYGVEPDKNNRCSCPIHGGDNATAFSISSDLQTWNCHSKCDCGGDIFTFVEKKEGVGNAQAKLLLMERFGLSDAPQPKPKKKPKPVEKSRQSYIYTDKDGNELYRVNRVDFSDGSKQCYQECNGKNTLPKEVRTLYNYHSIYGSTDYIFLCEGEKTADAVIECGMIGTTNPLGSKSWDESYAELLRDMKVVVLPDADEHGEKWRDHVLKTLRGIVEQVQVFEVPEAFVKKHTEYTGHDFADMVEAYGHDKGAEWLSTQLTNAPTLPRGIDSAILGRPSDGFDEIMRKAKAGIRSDVFNLNEWLPSLDIVINQGDLLVVMANTGVGKTRIAHNIPYAIKRINFAMFDLELGFTTLCERWGAMVNGISHRHFKERALMGRNLKRPEVDNVYIQKVPRLTVDKIRSRVEEIEQITGKEIHAVCVDYIGLMAGVGSAYEATSTNVEAFKAYVAEKDKVGILTTQVSRPPDKEHGLYECPSAFSAKNSGSVENSSQCLLGFWRVEGDKTAMKCKCLKYTHGEYPYDDIDLVAHDLLIEERR